LISNPMREKLRQQFLDFLRFERGLSLHTLQAYRRDLADLHEFLQKDGELGLDKLSELSQIKHQDLRLWLGALLQAQLKPRSIARKVSAVRCFFDYLRNQALIDANPAQRLKLPKIGRSLPVFLKEPEVEQLLAPERFADTFRGQRDRCLLELLYGCGLRRSEVIALKTSDLTFNPPSLRISGKGNKQRFVPFGPTLTEVLGSYLQWAKAEGLTLDGPLLMRENGQGLYPNLVYRIVKQQMGLAGDLPKGSPHVLRHTYATHLLDRGADLNAIKELLGHQSLAATQVYTHNSISKLRSVHKLTHPRAEHS
ncbi:MAG: tyrosine-type recombinase/integrase, partial [Bacteroidota bacterium]